MHQQNLPKLITIVGPTTSGKTSWGIKIAKKIGGEIISADSRQVYRHMDIGTAKEPGTWKYTCGIPPYRSYLVDDVSHHLMDYIDPKKRYTVAQFQHDAIRKIDRIQKRNNIPMIVGGTGLYVQSVVDNFLLPTVMQNQELRATLEGCSTETLVAKLQELDLSAAQTIDVHNRRRIIRAIEVATYSTDVTPKHTEPRYDTLQIGIHVERDVLYTRINERVDQMLQVGLLDEIEKLLSYGYTWDLPSMSSVGYRQFQPYFEGTSPLEDCIETFKRDTRRYAKRQLTWFRRDDRILWCSTLDEAQSHIDSFFS